MFPTLLPTLEHQQAPARVFIIGLISPMNIAIRGLTALERHA
jgi:hypothetical protein